MGSKAYSGVGSRSTPNEIQEIMRRLAKKLASQDYILRSGGADGADKAFEDGWWDYHMSQDIHHNGGKLAEIYIPWNGFNDHWESSHDGANRLPMHNFEDAKQIASTIHPAWDKCSYGAQRLHARNCYQVLGENLDSPSQFLVCWAETDKEGIPKGGTRTAWALAEKYDIPCFNLIFEEHLARIKNFIG